MYSKAADHHHHSLIPRSASSCLRHSDILAYKEIFRNSNFCLKLFWIIFAAILTVFMIFHTVKTINYALHKQSFSKISYLSLSDNPEEIDFKAQLCFPIGHGLNYSQLAEDQIQRDQVIQLIELTYKFNDWPIRNCNGSNFYIRRNNHNNDTTTMTSADACSFVPQYKLIDNILYHSTLSNSTKFDSNALRAVMDRYGLKCDQMFVNCSSSDPSHRLRRLAFKEFKCCDYIKPIFHIEYGQCFQILIDQNVLPNHMTSAFNFAIKYQFINLGNYPMYFNSDKTWQSANDNIILHIDESGTAVQAPWLTYKRLRSGQSYTITLSFNQIEDERISSNNRKICINNNEIDNRHFSDYNTLNCYYEKAIMTRSHWHGCYLPFIALINRQLNDSVICNRSSLIADLNQEDIVAVCPPLCKRLDIGVHVGVEETYLDSLGDIDVVIAHGKSYIVRTAQDPALDWSEWLGLIGGTIGLWLGYTVSHLVYFGIHLAHNLTVAVSKQMRKRSNKVQSAISTPADSTTSATVINVVCSKTDAVENVNTTVFFHR